VRLTAPVTTLEIRSPADGRPVGRVPADGAGDVHALAQRLRAAQPAWEALEPGERAAWLGRLRDWVLDHQDELAAQLREETGKAGPDAALEVLAVVSVITYFSGRAAPALARERRRPAGPLTLTKELHVARRPYPLVGVITPWNFPLVLPAMDAVPALLAGAAVLLKPSEVTPLTIARLADAWRELGAPDVLGVAQGGAEAGTALVDAVDFVQFTGSTATGRAIAVRAAERLIPCGLELGGKDPMLVLADADVQRAANAAAWGGLFNSGQVCVSVERVYVEDAVHDAFVEALVQRVQDLRHGPAAGDAADIGAMATDAQVDIVAAHVDDAVARGARVLTGGRRGGGPGRWYEPTVLVDVDHDMRVMTEETFGPVLPVMRVAGPDEAVRLANDSPYGLSASVWCADHRRGQQLAARLEAGAVNVNDVFANLFAAPLPMGGWKSSGLGARLGGDDALRKYCRTQAVATARLTPTSELAWYPYSALKSAVAASVVRLADARGLRRRLGL